MSTELELSESQKRPPALGKPVESPITQAKSHNIFVSWLGWHDPNSGMFFPGRKLVKSKYNCSMNSLLHLFRVCHFHGPLINKWLHRNIRITLMARGHFMEDLKWLVPEKSCEVFPRVKQWACWLHEVALVCFATLGSKRTAVLNHDSHRNKAGQMMHALAQGSHSVR